MRRFFMKKRKNSPLVRFLLRTLMLILALAGGLLLTSGVLLLCEDPLTYSGVGAVCALLLIGFFFGTACPREEGFLFCMLSPVSVALLMLVAGMILTKGHISLSPLLNHLFFLVSAALGRSIPRRKRRKHG